MTGAQIYQRALKKTHTNANDYSTTTASEDMNLRFMELVDEIVNEVDEGHFWDEGLTDTVVNQSEYVAESLGVSPDDLDIKKINKVFIKYTSGDDFQRVYPKNPSQLEKHTDWYKTNQSKSDPFFYIQDKSIFVYPAPDEAVTSGLQLNVIHQPADIDTDSTEDAIELPFNFHYVIALGMAIDIYQGQGKINEKNDAINDFERGKKQMIDNMKERYNQPGVSVMPNLTIYE